MHDDIALQPDQEELLARLVEAVRNVPREKRSEFVLIRVMGDNGDIIIHDGFPGGHELSWYHGDIHALAKEGLLTVMRHGNHGQLNFDVSPRGFRYYEHSRLRSGQPVKQLEVEVQSYLEAEIFMQRYPAASQKWSEAARLLWSSDSQDQGTTIGHLCREAMQNFAAGLIQRYQPPNAPERGDASFGRVKAVVLYKRPVLGDRKADLLDALLVYWDKAINLIQRQEHGAQKRGESLVWEDGRRAVFQTAIVMFEIDRSLA